METKRRAVILLSGGLDSATVAALAAFEQRELYALTFRYGQKHSAEIGAALKIAERLRVKKHVIVPLPAEIFDSALVEGSGREVRQSESGASGSAVPDTYVPGRNILFLSFALSWAESIGAGEIYIGINAVDYSGYPDCRPEFMEKFREMSVLGTRAGTEGKELNICAPLIDLKKSEIIRLGLELNFDYSITRSCYVPGPCGEACGLCDSCRIRLDAFAELGIEDPAPYQPDARTAGPHK